MSLQLYLVIILMTMSIEQQDNDSYPDIDLLLAELDNVVENGMESIPDDLVQDCQLALSFWSVDGREDTDNPPSTPEDHADADRLIAKIQQTHLALGGNLLDRRGFIRDVFRVGNQWLVAAVQYYSFIDYYDNPMGPSTISKLIQWIIYWDDFEDGFAPMYHLERSHSDELGFTHVLGRKMHPNYHESLIMFDSYCPSYMELKALIIGDMTGEAPLHFLVASGFRD